MTYSDERMEQIRKSVDALVEEMRTLDSYESEPGRLLVGVYNDLSEEFEALRQAALAPGCETSYDYNWIKT